MSMMVTELLSVGKSQEHPRLRSSRLPMQKSRVSKKMRGPTVPIAIDEATLMSSLSECRREAEIINEREEGSQRRVRSVVETLE